MHDICTAFRQEWPCLVIYYAIAICITVVVWRVLRVSRFLYSGKRRLIVAAVLALVFTPGVISDFWLFMVPGPAIVGLLLILPTAIFHPAVLAVAFLYYILPLTLCLYVFRFFLWLCVRRRIPPVTSPNTPLEPPPTAP